MVDPLLAMKQFIISLSRGATQPYIYQDRNQLTRRQTSTILQFTKFVFEIITKTYAFTDFSVIELS
jgi:hypothetical protein